MSTTKKNLYHASRTLARTFFAACSGRYAEARSSSEALESDIARTSPKFSWQLRKSFFVFLIIRFALFACELVSEKKGMP